MSKIISLPLIFLFFFHSIHPHGFCAGTQIQTAQGYANIENQSIGTHVQSLNSATQYCLQPVTHITKTKANCFVRIWFNDEYLDTSPDQLFYCPHEEKWIPAQQLASQSILTKNISQDLIINNIEIIHQDAEFYSITVANDHTFFVTEQQILTHNILPIVIGFSFAFGGGIEFLGATIGISTLGLLLGFKFYNDRSKKELQFQRLENSPTIPTINANTSIVAIEPRKSGCGSTQPATIEDHILIAPIQKPKEPNRGCYNPVPVPERKPGCGGSLQQKTDDFILQQETTSQKPGRFVVTPENVKGEISSDIKTGIKLSNSAIATLDKINKKVGLKGTITNKIATQAAKELGFEKIGEMSRGRAIFRKGNKYISADKYRHNGGFWNMANSVDEIMTKPGRLGTYDIFLNKIGD